MRNIGTMELVLIVLVIVLIFGAAKLPQLGRAVGDTLKEFKKSMKDASTDEKAEEKSTEKK
ncbi:MAG TPA: twin-arginine translocase TatA/TatE family subunit [Symbiobacteriaceae bacterium]|nr:twin-arginine translocase TatA/TatE family subunit [Symbiobacteriaceae bacterium]